jgi:hypothetical protein
MAIDGMTIDEFDEKVCEEIKYDKTVAGCIIAEGEQIDKIQGFMRLKHIAQEELRARESRLARVYKERYNHYKFDYDRTLTAEEIKRYVSGDDAYRKTNKACNLKKLELEAIEDAIAGYKDRGWRVKNLIELMKMNMEYGIY